MASYRDELRVAYEGLEGEFADAAERDRYRAAMLAKTAEQADFLTARLKQRTILEVGCGNGRLLIELARRGAVTRGLGVDLARSRVEFAAAWARELRLGSLAFEVADALEMPLAARGYDAIVCITGAFAYFEPLGPGVAAGLAARWAQALTPGGALVLELYPHPELRPVLDAAGGSVRLWRELDDDDPWRFYLSDLRLEQGVLVHDKTFVHRTSGEIDAGRRERIRLYSEAEIRDLLLAAGFGEVSVYEGWSGTPYAGGPSMVLTASTSPASTNAARSAP